MALLAAVLMATPAQAVDEVNTRRLRNAVTVAGILGHERVFQRIANQNGGTRASGTPGYDASADYVAGRLRAAGYTVTEQEFVFPFYQELEPAVLEQVTPTPTTYETGTFDFSGTGDVTGVVVPTNDIVIPPTPTRARPRAVRTATSPPPRPTSRGSRSSSAAPAPSRRRRPTPLRPATTRSSSSTRATRVVRSCSSAPSAAPSRSRWSA